MANENEIKILDLIPAELRPQLEMEVLQSIEEKKRQEREKERKHTVTEEVTKLVDQLFK
jgi:FMN-dependent NADH-azoreductase